MSSELAGTNLAPPGPRKLLRDYVAQKKDSGMSLSLDSLPINAFDFVLIMVLLTGILRGRKHGMSEELMNLLKWLAILIGSALIYEQGGRILSQSTPFSLLTCYLLVYTCSGLMIFGIFALIRRGLGGKLVGSDVFGGAEYYLGMGAGLARCSCILLAAMALLNARYFTPKEVIDMEKFQNDVYGSNFFPTLHSVQATVFEKSLAGPWIKDKLSFLLIKPTKPEDKQLRQKEFELP
jgi:uncharacterized membrane protein required for colicin V production